MRFFSDNLLPKTGDSGVSVAAGLNSDQPEGKRNFWDSVSKSAVVGFRIWK
jgi:hypothetical protein